MTASNNYKFNWIVNFPKKSSAIAEMATQCCTCRNVTLSGVTVFNANFLSILREYHHKSYITERYIHGVTFLSQTLRVLISIPLAWLAHRATTFDEIMQHNSNYTVQGHSRSPILVPKESLFATFYVSTTVTNICLTPFLRHHRHWSYCGHWQWVPLFNTHVSGKPKSSGFSLRYILYHSVRSVFQYLEPFRHDSRVWQTER